MIDPFDDPLVIAGHGTIGLELIEQCQGQVDGIFVPVGGGGLISGVASFVKKVWPQTKIIGVEIEGATTMAQSLEAGERVFLKEISNFTGYSVRQISEEPYRICNELVDDMVMVTNDEICAG